MDVRNVKLCASNDSSIETGSRVTEIIPGALWISGTTPSAARIVSPSRPAAATVDRGGGGTCSICAAALQANGDLRKHRGQGFVHPLHTLRFLARCPVSFAQPVRCAAGDQPSLAADDRLFISPPLQQRQRALASECKIGHSTAICVSNIVVILRPLVYSLPDSTASCAKTVTDTNTAGRQQRCITHDARFANHHRPSVHDRPDLRHQRWIHRSGQFSKLL